MRAVSRSRSASCKDMKQFYSQLKEALKDLSDQKYGRILRMVQDYIDGKEPDTEKLSKNDRMIFSLAKMALHNQDRFQVLVPEVPAEEQSKKRRGAPLGNKNAASPKNNSETIENNSETIENNSENKSYNNNNIYNINNNNSDPETILEKIKADADAAGFPIGDQTASDILNAAGNPAWVLQDHSFTEFLAWKVRDGYKDKKKTPNDLTKLFMGAYKWNGIKKQYPRWREDHLTEEKQTKKRTLKANPPQVCPDCGAKLDRGLCRTCEGRFVFNEGTLQYDWQKGLKLDQKEILMNFLRSHKFAGRGEKEADKQEEREDSA